VRKGTSAGANDTYSDYKKQGKEDPRKVLEQLEAGFWDAVARVFINPRGSTRSAPIEPRYLRRYDRGFRLGNGDTHDSLIESGCSLQSTATAVLGCVRVCAGPFAIPSVAYELRRRSRWFHDDCIGRHQQWTLEVLARTAVSGAETL
jgi:hypothetical protein